MGRIKTTLIKRTTNELIEAHGSEFTDDFSKNKGLVEKFLEMPSKKIRNIIVGYVTRITRKKQET